jgi:hypothetical protein
MQMPLNSAKGPVQLAQNQRVELIEVVGEADLEPGYGMTPAQVPGALGDSRLNLEHGLRDLLEPLERCHEFAAPYFECPKKFAGRRC